MNELQRVSKTHLRAKHVEPDKQASKQQIEPRHLSMQPHKPRIKPQTGDRGMVGKPKEGLTACQSPQNDNRPRALCRDTEGEGGDRVMLYIVRNMCKPQRNALR